MRCTWKFCLNKRSHLFVKPGHQIAMSEEIHAQERHQIGGRGAMKQPAAQPYAATRSVAILTVLSVLSPLSGLVMEMVLAWRYVASGDGCIPNRIAGGGVG